MSSRDETPWTYLPARHRLGPQTAEDVGDVFMTVVGSMRAPVVLDLEHPATFGERYRRAHGIGHPVA